MSEDADDAITQRLDALAARRRYLRKLGLSPFVLTDDDILGTRGGTLFPYAATVTPRHTRVYRYDDTVKVRKQQSRARRLAARALSPSPRQRAAQGGEPVSSIESPVGMSTSRPRGRLDC